MNNFNKICCLLLLFAVAFISCDPYEEDDINIGNLPDAPTFTVEVLGDQSNRVVITNTATGFYNAIWDIEGGLGTQGTPNVSTLNQDTVLYQSMGTYVITLHAISTAGNGTSSSSQTVTMDQDVEIECDEKFIILTENCTAKCWKLGTDSGAIKVGPTQLSGEWFTSGALPPFQADDYWCFNFDGLAWSYNNSGSTLSSCQGNSEVTDYNIPTGVTFNVFPSSSTFSTYKIILPEGAWIGVEDTGPEYEIVSISEGEMLLLTPITPCDGSASPGWFTIVMVPQ